MHIVRLGTRNCVRNVEESLHNERDCGPGGTAFAPGANESRRNVTIKEGGRKYRALWVACSGALDSTHLVVSTNMSTKESVTIFTHFRPSVAAPFQVFCVGGDGLGCAKTYNAIPFGARGERIANSTAALAQLAAGFVASFSACPSRSPQLTSVFARRSRWQPRKSP